MVFHNLFCRLFYFSYFIIANRVTICILDHINHYSFTKMQHRLSWERVVWSCTVIEKLWLSFLSETFEKKSWSNGRCTQHSTQYELTTCPVKAKDANCEKWVSSILGQFIWKYLQNVHYTWAFECPYTGNQMIGKNFQKGSPVNFFFLPYHNNFTIDDG
jgi:hypothetical protein